MQVIFTHLRRTGGSVLEKMVLFPSVACEQGLVLPPPPPPPSLRRHRTSFLRSALPFGHSASVHAPPPPSPSQLWAKQQATLARDPPPSRPARAALGAG